MLLNMCDAIGLCTLNDAYYTYISGLGCSAIDYTMASEELYDMLLLSTELNVADIIESSHFPVKFLLITRNRAKLGIKQDNNELCQIVTILQSQERIQ